MEVGLKWDLLKQIICQFAKPVLVGLGHGVWGCGTQGVVVPSHRPALINRTFRLNTRFLDRQLLYFVCFINFPLSIVSK